MKQKFIKKKDLFYITYHNFHKKKDIIPITIPNFIKNKTKKKLI